tara:strand:- start:241 stop:747 length:507 start_codon:yes stop_codon:yes gene_type:complete
MIEIKWVDGAEFYALGEQYKILDGKLFCDNGRRDWFESSYDLDELKSAPSYTERPKQDDSTDEWPKVGDDVLLVSIGMTTYNKPVRLTYIGDGVGCYVDSVGGKEYTYAKRETIFKKPKTPEEKLRDELIKLTLTQMEDKSHPIEANAYYLISEIMSKYNITKKPRGG